MATCIPARAAPRRGGGSKAQGLRSFSALGFRQTPLPAIPVLLIAGASERLIAIAEVRRLFIVKVGVRRGTKLAPSVKERALEVDAMVIPASSESARSVRVWLCSQDTSYLTLIAPALLVAMGTRNSLLFDATPTPPLTPSFVEVPERRLRVFYGLVKAFRALCVTGLAGNAELVVELSIAARIHRRSDVPQFDETNTFAKAKNNPLYCSYNFKQLLRKTLHCAV